jgi:cytochrome c oxidase cbb3-type subunit 1
VRAAELAPGLSSAVRHSLVWLVLGNSIGVLIAILLLAPGLNPWLGEWTYGRWMMVHMNTALYGWCSLPMVGFLFKAYDVDRGEIGRWCRPVVWLWSAGLLIGCFSWLSGHSSGKLFLDWSGFARIFFPLAIGALWVVLAWAFIRSTLVHECSGIAVPIAKATALLVLSAVPFAIYFASSPDVYPFVNPDTGGPTGQSQLESSLGVVLILLALPFGLTRRKDHGTGIVLMAWLVFAAEAILCGTLARADVSHRVLTQWLSLGSLLAWLPLIPAYYNAFRWHAKTRRWRIAFLWWWGGLVVTGWILFLPGVLDRFKFTDGLVGHSLTAVAGFLTAFEIFVLVQLIGDEHAQIFNRGWSFYAWNLGVLAYVVVMTIAGWIEGADPGFTIVPGALRNLLYSIRLCTGLAMFAGSMEWLVAAFSRPIAAIGLEPETAEARVA